ncbi:TetR/AcrR family transcriptional regulator [Vreelandella boliviensis]|uniref:TetR/AcrR family transcriptional regulator n=1 Tax=Vreelandella boliviensis TaxID=223527 RepID=UPI001B8D1C68|nr:TetR/AcrR family transcriptional regulator [Halomonas boliviensis]MBS3669991.1 TetR/AcrR family transcriptional regulator [Halomonas boliviensis]
MAKRLSKSERREQLLAVAENIVRTQGTDALTLITLAEQAGVSKPITYEHFISREGLFEDLYKRYDRQLIASIELAKESGFNSLETAARIISDAYLECALSCGREYDALVAALMAYPEHAELKHQIRNYFVEEYIRLFRPLAKRQTEDIRPMLIAYFGATEEMSRAVLMKQVDRKTAVTVLATILIAGLG